MKNKKGQVTIFAIIGIVMVILVLGGIYLASTNVEVDPFSVVENQNPELLEIRSQVEFCLNELTKEALVKVGRNAGYVEPKQGLIVREELPYANTGVNFFGNSIPYAHHLTSNPRCQNCMFSTTLPPLNEGPNNIKNQVESYVEQNIETCSDFDRFQERFIIETSTPAAHVLFDELDTKTRLDWSLTVKPYDTERVLTERYFDSVLDIRFNSLYNVIEEILYTTLISENLLEKYVLEVMQYLSFADIIPPTVPETRFTNTPNIYNLNDVETALKTELADNMNLIQTPGTRNYNRPVDVISPTEFLYEKFQVHLNAPIQDVEPLRINFNYLSSWPTYVKVNPSYGTVAMPRRNPLKIGPLSTINRMEYEFWYDLALPMLVEIEDTSAFSGMEPYLFRFPYEVNIRDTRIYELEYEEDLITSKGFNDPTQQTQELTINTIDGYTALPIEGVSLSYDCVDQSLAIGETQIQDGVATLSATVPPCIGASISTIGDEYVSQTAYVTSNSLTIPIYERKEVQVRLDKQMLSPTSSVGEMNIVEYNWTYSGMPGSYELGEEVQVFLNLLIDGEPTMIFETANFSLDNPVNTFRLVPGEYQIIVLSSLDLESYYLGEKNYFETEEEIMEIKDSGILFGLVGGVDEEIPIAGQRFNDTMLIGMVSFEEELQTITASQLQNSNTLVIPYLAFDLEDVTYSRQLIVYGSLLEVVENNPSNFKFKFE